MEGRPSSILRRGAESGAVMGLYLLLLLATMVGALSNGLLSIVFLLMAVVVTPMAAYRRLRHSFDATGRRLSMSALWCEGIVMMIGASLIAALGAFVFMRFIDPTFVVATVKSSIAAYQASGNPDLQSFAATLQSLIDNRLIPRPIELAISLAWFGAFTGSLLSLVVAAIITSRRNRRASNN